jgi:hypothetical protein
LGPGSISNEHSSFNPKIRGSNHATGTGREKIDGDGGQIEEVIVEKAREFEP